MRRYSGKRVFGITGYSGSGKTTLIEGIVPRIIARGYSVSLIKHAHAGFDIDRPGKDSYRHREAGCREVLLASESRWVLMHERRAPGELDIDAHIARLSPCDLILVEGYKETQIPMLEVHRPAHGKPPLFPYYSSIVAIACDAPVDTALMRIDLNDHEAVTNFVLRAVQLEQALAA